MYRSDTASANPREPVFNAHLHPQVRLTKYRRRGCISLLVEEGGRDIKKNAAKPPLMERTGWSLTENVSKCEFKTLLVSDHPVCAALVASHHFLNGAATPPHEEGNTPLAQQSTRPVKTLGAERIVVYPKLPAQKDSFT